MNELNFRVLDTFKADLLDPNLDIDLFSIGYTNFNGNVATMTSAQIVAAYNASWKNIPTKIITYKIDNNNFKIDVDTNYRNVNNYKRMVLMYGSSLDYANLKIAMISEDIMIPLKFSNKVQTISLYIRLTSYYATLLGTTGIYTVPVVPSTGVIIVNTSSATTDTVLSNFTLSDYFDRLKNGLPIWRNGGYFDSVGNLVHLKSLENNFDNQATNNIVIIQQIMSMMQSILPTIYQDYNTDDATGVNSAHAGYLLNLDKLSRGLESSWDADTDVGPNAPLDLYEYHLRLQNYLSTTYRASVSTPVGTVIFFAKNEAPTDYIKCNGAVVSRTTYASLFAVIGTTFNTGGEDGASFRLPDTRGKFVRSWNDNGTLDIGRAFGSTQLDAMQRIKSVWGRIMSETYRADGPQGTGINGAFSAYGDGANNGQDGTNDNDSFTRIEFDSANSKLPNIAKTHDSETRPVNIALLGCIKYANNLNIPVVPVTAPTSLTASSITYNSAYLSWGAGTSSVGISSYRIHVNGSYVGSVGGSTLNYTLNALASSTPYSVVVYAVDTDGTSSVASNTSSFTTAVYVPPIATLAINSSAPGPTNFVGALAITGGQPGEVINLSFELTYYNGTTFNSLEFDSPVTITGPLDSTHTTRTGSVTLDAYGEANSFYHADPLATNATCIVTMTARSSANPLPASVDTTISA